MTARKVRTLLLILVFSFAGLVYLEGPFTTPPGWWKIPRYWPLASGPVRWRIVAPVLKASGRLPELSWSELWGYARDFSSDPLQSGFVSLVDATGEGPCPNLWATPLGEIWGRSSDEDLLEFLLIEQLIERIYDHREAGVRPGDTVIDVGGHLGVFTLLALEKGARRVLVVEPEAVNLACLRKTFADEIRSGKVLLAEVAAWDSRTVLEFEVPNDGNTGGGKINDDGEVIYDTQILEVPAMTLDQIVEERALDRIDFLKMDIEGAERQALTGGRGLLARFAPRMVLCTYHKKDDLEVVTKIALEARPDYRFISDRYHVYFY